MKNLTPRGLRPARRQIQGLLSTPALALPQLHVQERTRVSNDASGTSDAGAGNASRTMPA
jgi:hypothetical protein